VLLFVDFSEVNRFSEEIRNYLNGANILVIDHHLADVPKNALVIKDAESMSTAEIVFEYAYAWRPTLFTPQIATYLYM
jgi:nanoRNase/pAp phosphatase (c-di-AMP/oligoRNAs hydrolase)